MNESARLLTPILLGAILLAPWNAVANETVRTSSPLDLWHDPTIFSPRFFPETENLSVEDIFVAGLEARFPHRISLEEPGISPGPEEEPLVESLLPGVTYVRVHHLGAALARIGEAIEGSSLILDLRYVEAERAPVVELGAILTINGSVRISLTEQAAGNGAFDDEEILIEAAGLRRPLQPVFVLTNQATAGPLEALLAELKDKGQIISIGTATAGRTGRFRHIETTPPLHVLSGEWRPASGASLLNEGFMPSVLMNVSADADLKAYEAMTAGESLRDLVAADPLNDERDPSADLQSLLAGDPADAPVEQTIDPILQRAYFIAIALRSMGKIADPAGS